MSKKRSLSETEKLEVQRIQRSTDGALRCYISGEIINLENDAIEYDHLKAFVNGGDTDTSNMRIFLKKFNREKGKMPLEAYKEYFNLKRLYEEKDNKVKLQDILAFKNIQRESFYLILKDGNINFLGNDNKNYSYELFYDPKLEIEYFYAQLPISWLKNDDEQGLQPRVIDFKRLNQLHKHFQSYPQLAPSIARLVNNEIKLFDGQHKLAAQILNNNKTIDIKVYISPNDEIKAKNIYEKLLKTNLEAHSKLAQVSFYTNTLFQKWNEMYSIKWEEYVELNPNEKHSEYNFLNFLLKKHERSEVKNMFEASIIKNVHDQSALKKYTAESNKDSTFPLSQDLLKKTIFKNTLFLNPSDAVIDSIDDFRDSEKNNYHLLAKILVEESGIEKWSPNKQDSNPEAIKARRIWNKASVLTWAPFLSAMLNAIFKLFDKESQDKKLYRHTMTEDEQKELRLFLNRLFNHPFWLQNDPAIDKAFAAASSLKSLFDQQNLKIQYILSGK
ncbi:MULTISPECIES: chromosome partitioning protein ParB [unclassified Acinetobacter]|uniref:chromosome partitioning protein ParB n=1 Tax=unclassified Acinetobacter TaxID=196816 RepID=UPI0015D42C78|nr:MULTISPECIES: chromosome partitioning protein ParB [unclassified Acinetobacter]UUS59678.1 chromosome partitioning protein ParB [Acinetobacter sp. YH16056_T]